MSISLDQQYKNFYYISCRKYSHNWCYCHNANIYNRRLFSGSFKTANWLGILFWIPLPRFCVNLCSNLYYTKGLIHCYFKIFLQKNFSYACMKSKEKLPCIYDVGDSATVSYLKVLSIVVSKENSENPLLGLYIRQRV
jgi:hypothetical protein